MPACCAMLCCVFLTGQEPGTSTIHGQITEDISRRGVEGVSVTLMGGDLREPVVVRTDGQGKFGFPASPVGRYTLQAVRAGFFALLKEVETKASGEQEDIGQVVLTAKRVVTGDVHWQDGEPAAGLRVGALLVERGALQQNGGSATLADSRGEFRFDQLRPGRYVISAANRADLSSVAARPRIAAPSYFPGGSSPNLRGSIDLRDSAEFGGVSIVLAETGGQSISGQVIGNSPLVGCSTFLSLMIPGELSGLVEGRVRVGDPFRMTGIPEGDYILGAVAECTSSMGVQRLKVGTGPVTGVQIAMPDHPSVVPIQVEFDDPSGKVAAPNVVVGFENRELGGFGRSQAVTEANGRSGMSLVSGLAYEMSLDHLESAHPNAYIAQVAQGSRRLAEEEPFLVSESGGEVRILLKRDGAVVRGKVVGEGGVVRGAVVVVAPKNRAFNHRYRAATTSNDGSFEVSGLAPGDYGLFAFDGNVDIEGDYLDADFLALYSSQATALEAVANGTYALDLRVVEQR